MLPDHYISDRWVHRQEHFPSDAQFLLATDGFYGAFDDPHQLWNWLAANKSALAQAKERSDLMRQLHDPHLPVVLDDISALLQEDCFRDMLKGLCESGERNLHWGTTTSKLEGRPRSFRCTSPVLIVMNKIPSRDADVAAILDRCDAIEFAPTKSEVIARMHELFPAEAELIDLIAELPTLPSLRTLIKARRWQNSRHLKLVEELLAECGAPQAVVHLARIIKTHPESEWCARYLAETGLTDRTYRRHKRLALQLVDCRAAAEPCPDVRGCVPDRSSTAADESNGCDTQP